MADLFKLFDGTLGAGGASSVSSQNASSFSAVSSENDLVSILASGTDSVDLLVDYSDFSNFVTFNSAESYVNVTSDDILNGYPFDGAASDVQNFINSLDGYQRFFLSGWPAWCGHLRLNPAISSSYVSFNDFGVQDGAARTSFISPGTGSLSIQGWIDTPVMTGSNDVIVVFQKLRQGTTDGVTVFVSGSQVLFTVSSGSTSASVSSSLATVGPTFFAAVLDRSSTTGSVSMYSANSGTFPALGSQTTLILGSRFDLTSGSFYIGSGSVIGSTVRPFTGSIDALTVWSSARTLTDMTSSFNRRTYAQSGLLAAWNFNEASVRTPASFSSVVRDSSGHRLDGRIQRFFSGSRGSGSLHLDFSPTPILSLNDPDVVAYVVNAQVTGNLYDRGNDSLIFKLFPESFSRQDQSSSDIFQNFALILARHFDRVKVYINQLANLRKVEYGSFDQAPDELLDHVADFMGWQLDGNFSTTDALKYFIGRNIQTGTSANAPISTTLESVKSQFWRRVLLNLMYIYKSKGTRESVEALLRSYGVDNGFVRLKEYARRKETRPTLERVEAEKSVYSLEFVSGSSVSFSGAASLVNSSDQLTAELRVRFPGPTDTVLAPTELSGAIINLRDGITPDQAVRVSLWYEKPSVTSLTGNIYLTSSAGRLQLVSASIFDDKFYNLAVVRDRVTGSVTVYAKRVEDDELVYSTSSVAFSGSTGYPFDCKYSVFELGSSAITGSRGQFWGQEARLWRAALTSEELASHAYHFESYGRDVQYGNQDLEIHWRLNDNVTPDGGGNIFVVDSTVAKAVGTGSGYISGQSPFVKFLEDYSYIPSLEYGWNQKKVRTFDGSTVDDLERYRDERFVSLEFNLYDALNEDISHLMTSYDELNNVLGLPVNRYREDYEGLVQMRETYFKRLQGDLSFKVFVDMLDFFDSTFVDIVRRLLPARTLFKGDELVVESHMLERAKYQYQIRPVREGIIDISGSVAMTDLWGSTFR